MIELFQTFLPGSSWFFWLRHRLVPHHYRQFCLLSVIAMSAFSMTAGSGVHWEVEVSGFNLI